MNWIGATICLLPALPSCLFPPLPPLLLLLPAARAACCLRLLRAACRARAASRRVASCRACCAARMLLRAPRRVAQSGFLHLSAPAGGDKTGFQHSRASHRVPMLTTGLACSWFPVVSWWCLRVPEGVPPPCWAGLSGPPPKKKRVDA